MVRWLVGAEVLVLRLGLCRAQMYGAAAGPGGAPAAFGGEAVHAAPPLSASRRSALSGRRAARVPACAQRGDGRVGRIVDDGAAGSAPVAEDTAASAAHLGACVGARGGQGGPCPRGCAVYRIVCRRAVSISREKIETSKISMKYLLEACERPKFPRAGGAAAPARPPGARPRSLSRPANAGGALARAKSRRF